MNILVLGEGAWGTAISSAIALDHNVFLWCADKNVAATINAYHVNHRYAPTYHFASHIIAVSTFTALPMIDLILVTTPVAYLEQVLAHLRPWYQQQRIIFLCKGMMVDTGELPTEICARVLGVAAEVLVGPSFAHDLFNHARTALVYGCQPAIESLSLEKVFKPYVMIMQWHDVIGLQLVAAYKNVVSIGCGILAGMETARNTQALFFTRACNEMRDLLTYAEADEQTFYTPAGIGDLFLTATSPLSRNYSFGVALGAGQAVSQVRAQYSYAEGPQTLLSLHNQQKRNTWCLPIIEALHDIVYQNADLQVLDKVC